jgi:adenylate kinase
MSAGVRAVLLGAPGSGKGTQAERLAAALGVPAISTGELLRRAVAEESPLGRKVGEVMAAGRLVDDALMSEVVRERLAEGDARGGFLLDGYPRTCPQAATLEEILGAGARGSTRWSCSRCRRRPWSGGRSAAGGPTIARR